MRGDIVLAGFVLTADEWDAMDTFARAQLLRGAARNDLDLRSELRLPPIPPPPRRRDDDDYEVYEVIAS